MPFKQLLLFGLVACFFSCVSTHKETETVTDPIDTIAVQRVSLFFAGDLMLHQVQIDSAHSKNGFDFRPSFEYMKEEILSVDIAVANLEVTLGGKPYTGYPLFSAPDEFADAVKDAGFDLLLTANNHILDRGRRGLERTISLLDTLGISHLGIYKDEAIREKNYPLVVEKSGFRFVFLNYTYGTNGLEETPPNVINRIDKEVMAEDILKAKNMEPDCIFACMHWGDEYQFKPDNQQRKLVDWLLEQGVDHIIGAHPHVIQPVELRLDSVNNRKNLVAYSLGNFISNMSAQGTDGGMVIRMEFEKDSVVRLADCHYGLVWTARPDITGNRYHQIIPAAFPDSLLKERVLKEKDASVGSMRYFLQENSKNINEYFFAKKQVKSLQD